MFLFLSYRYANPPERVLLNMYDLKKVEFKIIPYAKETYFGEDSTTDEYAAIVSDINSRLSLRATFSFQRCQIQYIDSVSKFKIELEKLNNDKAVLSSSEIDNSTSLTELSYTFTGFGDTTNKFRNVDLTTCGFYISYNSDWTDDPKSYHRWNTEPIRIPSSAKDTIFHNIESGSIEAIIIPIILPGLDGSWKDAIKLSVEHLWYRIDFEIDGTPTSAYISLQRTSDKDYFKLTHYLPLNGGIIQKLDDDGIKVIIIKIYDTKDKYVVKTTSDNNYIHFGETSLQIKSEEPFTITLHTQSVDPVILQQLMDAREEIDTTVPYTKYYKLRYRADSHPQVYIIVKEYNDDTVDITFNHITSYVSLMSEDVLYEDNEYDTVTYTNVKFLQVEDDPDLSDGIRGGTYKENWVIKTTDKSKEIFYNSDIDSYNTIELPSNEYVDLEEGSFPLGTRTTPPTIERDVRNLSLYNRIPIATLEQYESEIESIRNSAP